MASDAESQLPAAVRWECVDKHRYYMACVQRNLFGELEVWRAWGGIGSLHGGQQCDPVADLKAAVAKLATIERRRRARGYFGRQDAPDRAAGLDGALVQG